MQTPLRPVTGNLSGTCQQLLDWGKLFLDQYKRKSDEINLSEFINKIAEEYKPLLQERGNGLQFNFNESNSWIGDEKVLQFICENLLKNINNRNQNNTITVSTFDEAEYTVLVLRHEGTPLLRPELDSIYRTVPDVYDSPNSRELYYCWHSMKLLGGFITVPASVAEKNYITVGLPKNYLAKKWFMAA